jgi:hypothetical protein
VFTVGYSLHAGVFIYLIAVLGVLTLGYQAPKVLILGVGATINFCAPGTSGGPSSYQGYPVDVTFDDSAAVDTATAVYPSSSLGNQSLPPNGSGNIAPFACDTDPTGACVYPIDTNMVRARRFPVAGIYHYHSSLYPSDTFTIMIKKD